MILSGFIFPISSMPGVVQAITHIVPARYFIVALRSIVLKGTDITAFWQDMVALAIFATVALGLASLRLRQGVVRMSRVLHLMRKELLELKQDPRLFGIVIIAPIIQLTVLGYAATTDVKDIPIVVVDTDRSTASRALIHRFEASDNFKIVGMPGSTGEIDRYLDRGEAWMALTHSAGLRTEGGVRPADDAADRGRRHRLQFHRRGDGLRADRDRRIRPGSGGRGGARQCRSADWCSRRFASGSIRG